LTGEIEKQLRQLYASGRKAKEAVAIVAGETGLPRKELYKTWLGLDRSRDKDKKTCQNYGRN